jgi:hypothetical protein
MHYIHWLTRVIPIWCSMSVGEFTESNLFWVFRGHPEMYVDQQEARDEPD